MLAQFGLDEKKKNVPRPFESQPTSLKTHEAYQSVCWRYRAIDKQETRQTILVTEVILQNPETLVLVVIVIEPSLATFPSQLPFIKLHVLGSSRQLELTCLLYGTKALPCCWACATSAFATVYRALCLTDRLRTQKKNVTKKKLRFSAYRRECNIKLC